MIYAAEQSKEWHFCPLDLTAFAWKWEDIVKESGAAGKLFKASFENLNFKGT